MSERGLYSHLLRHSRLEGKSRLRFSIGWLSRGVGIGTAAARGGARRLAAKRVLRLTEKAKRGHTIEVRLPAGGARDCARKPQSVGRGVYVERSIWRKPDFLVNRALRGRSTRARGRLLFLLPAPRVTTVTRCLDHIVPLARRGRNGYRNLVTCCSECTSAERRAAGGGLSAVAISQRQAGEWRTKRAAAGARKDGGGARFVFAPPAGARHAVPALRSQGCPRFVFFESRSCG